MGLQAGFSFSAFGLCQKPAARAHLVGVSQLFRDTGEQPLHACFLHGDSESSASHQFAPAALQSSYAAHEEGFSGVHAFFTSDLLHEQQSTNIAVTVKYSSVFISFLSQPPRV
jgi:hypothetical protein